MQAITHLSDIWEYTITKILNHDTKSVLGIMIRECVKYNKLEHFNSLLNFSVDDFTPSGNLCFNHYIAETAIVVGITLLQ